MSAEEFEQRIAGLKERHEGLTISVEHLARRGEEENERIAKQRKNIDRPLTIVETLASVVQSHEKRIESL